MRGGHGKLPLFFSPALGTFLIYSPIVCINVKCKKSAHGRVFARVRINGVDESRTRVRKSIPCPSTIVVHYFSFPPPDENEHPSGFSSFMVRPHAQSFACVVSHRIDVWVPKCECFRSDSCTQAASATSLSLAFIFNFAI